MNDEPTTNEQIAEEIQRETGEEIQRDRDDQDERDRLRDEQVDAESERAAIRATVAEAADNLIEAADDGRLEALVAEAEAAGHDDRADYYRALIVMAHAATCPPRRGARV
jgi:hypothetical protein